MLIPGDTQMTYVGDDDSKLDDSITVAEYMGLSDEEKKNWNILPDDIEDYEDCEFDQENCSIETCEEPQE